MNKFKNKILTSMKNEKQLEKTLNDLTVYQSNLLKNHSNPVFKSKDKNKILKYHTELGNLGKSLYRYNTLKQYENYDAAEKEKEDVSETVLHGGISNAKYIWRSEHGEHTCEKCLSMDGQEYEFYDEVPERPHPNCRCYVEVVEETETKPKSKKNEEPCDCWDKIDRLVEETDDWENEINIILGELDTIQDESIDLLSTIKDFKYQVELEQANLSNIEPCAPNCGVLTGLAINITDDTELENSIYNLIQNNTEAKQVYQIFLGHKHEMETAKDGLDKYYHAKANCTSAELGEIQRNWAILFSLLKEIKDLYVKVYYQKKTIKEVAADCLKDLKADWYGIQKAKEHGYCSDKVKDVYDIFE